jgi:nucleoside-diphosphate-sugar epimerase
MKRILVTGATGFAGGYILRELAAQYGKNSVTGTGRNPDAIRRLEAEGFKMCVGDLTDASFVAAKLSDYTEIVHCAALSSVWGSYELFYQANVITTRNLLTHLKTLRRFVYISSPSIYFNFTDRFDIREEQPLPKQFVNAYAETKYLAEQEILNHDRTGLTTVVIRPRAIMGAGDTVILPRLIKALEAGKLRIVGSGKNLADFTSARNLALAVRLVFTSGSDLNKQVFNITDGQPLVLWPMLQETIQRLGFKTELKRLPYSLAYPIAFLSEKYGELISRREPALTCYGIGILNYSMTLNIDKAREKLGYNPTVSTADSIAEFVNDYHRFHGKN